MTSWLLTPSRLLDPLLLATLHHLTLLTISFPFQVPLALTFCGFMYLDFRPFPKMWISVHVLS